MWMMQINWKIFDLIMRKLSIFDLTKNSVMRAFQLITGISLQSNLPTPEHHAAMLEGNILVPAICIIMVLVMVAGIVITVQKHKRY